MTSEKLAELERLARAAQNPLMNFEVSFQCKLEERDYLAYFSPQTCIEMIEEIRALRDEVLRYAVMNDDLRQQLKTARADALREAADMLDPRFKREKVKLISLIDKPSAKEGAE